METKEYIVALKDGVDYDQFWAEMEASTAGLPHIPDRPVNITNDRPVFDRICEYALTDEEAERVKNDPRVDSIEQPIENLPWVEITSSALQQPQQDNFNKPNAGNSNNNFVNWGLPRHSNSTNIYANNSNPPYTYGLDGTGVDVIISDSGIQADHPEFTDVNGVSRVYNPGWDAIATAVNATGKIGWDTASYVTGNTQIDGHGTHVAGTVAGKTYGWAKNARILSLKSYGTIPGNAGDIFTMIKYWHQNKDNKSRPTVVNMSWVFIIPGYQNLNPFIKGTYRGNTWTKSDGSSNFLTSKGLINTNSNGLPRADVPSPPGLPYNSKTYDTMLGELIDAGIIVCHAAGNNGFKKDIPFGKDYDNNAVTGPTAQWPNFVYYYHRGSSPNNLKAIAVGNIDSVTNNNTDQPNQGSVKGPGVDIWAAGTDIMSAWPKNAIDPNSGVSIPGNDYFKQPGQNWRQQNLRGTSMASPQVAGMCALYLQKYPEATPAEVKTWLQETATNTILNTGTETDYTNSRSLLGGLPRVAYQNLEGLDYSHVKDNNSWKKVKATYVYKNGKWLKVKAAYKRENGQWVRFYQL